MIGGFSGILMTAGSGTPASYTLVRLRGSKLVKNGAGHS